MSGKLRSPPPYRVDLASLGAFHERCLARSQRGLAAAKMLKRKAAEHTGRDAMKRARRELAAKPPLPPAEKERLQQRRSADMRRQRPGNERAARCERLQMLTPSFS